MATIDVADSWCWDRCGVATIKQQQELYAEQRQALEAGHRRSGTDVFLSPFDILKTGDGRERSYCTWPEGAVSSLPKTECIAFTGKIRGERWYVIVPWEIVSKTCDELLEPESGMDPLRFLTTGWPDASQLRVLAEAAIVRRGYS